MVRQSLRNILDLLPPKDYELIYELYFKNRSEKEYAQMLGGSQQAIHMRKKRILKKLKIIWMSRVVKMPVFSRIHARRKESSCEHRKLNIR